MDIPEFCIHPRSQKLLEWMYATALPGPLLITGCPAMGKHTLALKLAKRSLCHFNRIGQCDCPSCAAIKNGTNGDLLIIGDEDTALSVDTIRTIRTQISHTSLNPQGRVVLVLQAERLTHEASNALLKCIEEPLGNTQWILTALHVKRLSPTLLSRLYRLRLPRIPDATIVEWAATVLQSPQAPERLQEIAGRPGILKNLHDQDPMMRERIELVNLFDEGIWGGGDLPILDKDSSIKPEQIFNELLERLQQLGRTQTIGWDVWVERLHKLDQARDALSRHQSIDQILRYVYSS